MSSKLSKYNVEFVCGFFCSLRVSSIVLQLGEGGGFLHQTAIEALNFDYPLY